VTSNHTVSLNSENQREVLVPRHEFSNVLVLQGGVYVFTTHYWGWNFVYHVSALKCATHYCGGGIADLRLLESK
jgi:hypothetical protein